MRYIDRHGWLCPQPGIRHAPSPNANARPSGVDPYLLVIHNISLPPNQFEGDAIIRFFQNQLDFDAHPWFEHIRGVQVSAHFLIRRDGEIIQFVSTLDRAWHAGQSFFQGKENCNDFSIGIELEGADTIPYSDSQYERLAYLTNILGQRHPLRAVYGHEHIAPKRKTDPGPAFDWWRYAKLCQLPLRCFALD